MFFECIKLFINEKRLFAALWAQVQVSAPGRPRVMQAGVCLSSGANIAERIIFACPQKKVKAFISPAGDPLMCFTVMGLNTDLRR